MTEEMATLESIMEAIQGLTRTVLEGQRTAREASERETRTLELMREKMEDLSRGHESMDRRVSALEEWRSRQRAKEIRDAETKPEEDG
jgi:hypothetical protein